jgi:hypothetical protein
MEQIEQKRREHERQQEAERMKPGYYRHWHGTV